MEPNEVKECRLLYAENGEIKDNGTRWGAPRMLRADFPGPEWAIIPIKEVPENWREMTIEAGELIPASPDVIASRHSTRQVVEAEQVRVARESRYRTESDPALYDALEFFARNHPEFSEFSAWLASKDRIRQELAKPETVTEEEE